MITVPGADDGRPCLRSAAVWGALFCGNLRATCVRVSMVAFGWYEPLSLPREAVAQRGPLEAVATAACRTSAGVIPTSR